MLNLIRAARADFVAHQSPESVPLWQDVLTGVPIIALFVFALIA